MNILIVDDEANLRRTLRTVLESMKHVVTEAANQAKALEALGGSKTDLVLLDLRLGTESGLDVLVAMLRTSPGLGVIVITAYASIETAVEAMRRGALDYLPKPFTPQQLAEVLNRWGKRRSDESGEDVAILESAEPAMRRILETIATVAASDATVLLRGESGTGKASSRGPSTRRANAPPCPS